MATLKETTDQLRFKDTRNKLAVILNDIATIARQRGEMTVSGDETGSGTRSKQVFEKRPLADFLTARAKKVAAQAPFRVAVVGEFSRGKSTLINALLDREVLVSDFRPNTAARTILRYGEPERFRVTYAKGLGRSPVLIDTFNLKRDLAQYTSDASVHSSGSNRALLKGEQQSLAEQIHEVEVWCVSDFLKTREMEVCDTPGLGSVFPAHKAVTYEVIPTVDATLFLVQADPGPGESDILFLRYIREYVGQIFFVLTKKDMARSPEELEGMLEFVRATIEEQADLKVENLYAVSALQALQGKFEESGFPEFLRALESFLIRAGGVARLQGPYDLSRNYWNHLHNLVDADIKAIDTNINTLKAELKRLQHDEEKIAKSRDKLLRFVDEQIKDLCQTATDGMENLPAKIREEVESTIDRLDSLAKLNKVGDHIQPVIKEVSVGWLTKKEDRFRSKAELLFSRIEGDLHEILDTIQHLGEPKDYGLHMEVNSPQSMGTIFGQITWNAVFRGAIGGGLGFVAGIGATGIAAVVLGVTAAIPGALLLLPFVTGLFPIAREALGFKEKARKELKDKLLQPLPHNRVNLYQAVVEGFVTPEGTRDPGMRSTVEQSFREKGEELKQMISETVTNNLDSRLSQLRRQIQEKESGHQNREQELQKYVGQMTELETISKRLDYVSTTILELSQGRSEKDQAQLTQGAMGPNGEEADKKNTSATRGGRDKKAGVTRKPAPTGAKRK